VGLLEDISGAIEEGLHNTLSGNSIELLTQELINLEGQQLTLTLS
jgi:hypothetical protein